jgi:starvation-inducible outer membrane lipoprotein
VRRTRLVLAVPALALALSGCLTQPEEANDNGPQPQPDRPTDVVQEPAAESPAAS